MCVMMTFSGRVSVLARAKPCALASRTKCFIDTVSPARSKLRSNTVWAKRSGPLLLAVGRLKRQASMPLFQPLKTKLRSSPALTVVLSAMGPVLTAVLALGARAVTKSPAVLMQLLLLSSNARSMRTVPLAPVLPFHMT